MVVAETLFAVSGLIVAGESLGTSYDLTYSDDPFSVMVDLPTTEQSFQPRNHERSWRALLTLSNDEVRRNAKIRCVRVRMIFPERVRAVDIGPEPPVKEVYELACRIADTAISLGSERVAGFLEFIRVDRQFWLGLSMEPPRILDGPVLYDDSGDSHQRIPFGLVGGTVLQLYDQADWATETALTHAAASVVAGNVPPLEDRMLADARTILRRGPEALLPQALVLAAISTEIRIKRLLEELANEAQRSLVQILLNSPRDYSVAAQSLFDLPLKAVSGRSLKDDDRDLWKATGVLFTDRNAVAHRGASREVSTIRADVGTALRIKRYLISVTNGEMSSTDLELRFVANVGPPEPKEYRKNAE